MTCLINFRVENRRKLSKSSGMIATKRIWHILQPTFCFIMLKKRVHNKKKKKKEYSRPWFMIQKALLHYLSWEIVGWEGVKMAGPSYLFPLSTDSSFFWKQNIFIPYSGVKKQLLVLFSSNIPLLILNRVSVVPLPLKNQLAHHLSVVIRKRGVWTAKSISNS